MLKSLMVKELRESAGVVALAVLAALFAVANLAGLSLLPIFQSNGANGIPFVSDSFSFYLTLIAGGLAVALGLKQSAWEFGSDTYYFLLHRPIRRASVFWVKLVVGCIIVLGLGALMILGYSLWASSGRIGAPFFWSMTIPTWQWLLCLSLIYLTSFLSGIRPARWFGTRLAPAIAGLAVVFFIDATLYRWLVPIVVVLCAYVVLTAIFYYVRQRDY
jgi:hypothetical protein